MQAASDALTLKWHKIGKNDKIKSKLAIKKVPFFFFELGMHRLR